MSYELDERFIGLITASLRQAADHAPATLGKHAENLLHGTTIGAFIVGEGQYAIAFSDGKVSMGNKPVHLGYRKILTVDRYSRLLIAGSPVLGFAYAASLKAWVGYREDTTDQRISARAKARFLGRLLMGGMGLAHSGIVCAPILATFDIREKKCARIFSLGVEGSEVEHDNFAASGSGEGIDIWLRKAWEPRGGRSMSVDSGILLAREAVTSLAPQIDSFSGGKISIDVIGPQGAHTIE